MLHYFFTSSLVQSNFIELYLSTFVHKKFASCCIILVKNADLQAEGSRYGILYDRKTQRTGAIPCWILYESHGRERVVNKIFSLKCSFPRTLLVQLPSPILRFAQPLVCDTQPLCHQLAPSQRALTLVCCGILAHTARSRWYLF